jgi:hypothetical protein
MNSRKYGKHARRKRKIGIGFDHMMPQQSQLFSVLELMIPKYSTMLPFFGPISKAKFQKRYAELFIFRNSVKKVDR